MEVKIQKKIGEFHLDIQLESDASRIGILGASGSGKSMMLKSIAGIEQVDAGRIRLGERTLLDTSQKINVSTQKRKIGYMFQHYALFPTMTVEKNIEIPLKCGKLEKKERVEEIMERFRIQELRNRYPGQLSGGQQQRVALARILVYKPELILLDEPFSALDQYLKDQLQFELLELLEGYKGQVIMVSHSRDEIYRFSEELYIMQKGHILTGGKTDEVFRSPKWVEAAKMTGCKNFSAVRKETDAKGTEVYYAQDWGTYLTGIQAPSAEWDQVGYRAHYFEPLWMDVQGFQQENVIEVRLERVDEMPFENKYYFHPVIDGKPGAATLCWFQSNASEGQIRGKGIPTHLRLQPEHIMGLKMK